MLRCPEYGVFLSMRHFTSPNGGQDNGKQCIIQFPSFPDSSQCLCVRVCRYVSYISVCNLYICEMCTGSGAEIDIAEEGVCLSQH